jgi:AraC-like DNA-binding protein
MSLALTLSQATNLPVTQIAMNPGYESPSRFAVRPTEAAQCKKSGSATLKSLPSPATARTHVQFLSPQAGCKPTARSRDDGTTGGKGNRQCRYRALRQV